MDDYTRKKGSKGATGMIISRKIYITLSNTKDY